MGPTKEPTVLTQRLQTLGMGHLRPNYRERVWSQPLAEQWIQDLLSMACPLEQDPDFPTASLSHLEACTSLLSSPIRGQTKEARTSVPWPPGWKPELQK